MLSPRFVCREAPPLARLDTQSAVCCAAGPPTSATVVRTDLSAEAVRLARVLVQLMPDEPEAVGLPALMLLTDARRPARLAVDGSMVRVADQDRSRWDRGLIDESHDLVRARLRRNRPGPFQVRVRAGRAAEAVAAYDRAIGLTTNGAEGRFLREQRAGAERRA